MFHWNVFVIPAAAAALKWLGIASKSSWIVIGNSFFVIAGKAPAGTAIVV
jgi:hypothetical protein